MNTPTYTGQATIGGANQQVLLAKGSAIADTLITRQSGSLVLTCVGADGTTAFDLSSVTSLDCKVKPYNTAETAVTLGTGVISGAGNNIYTVSWVKDKIPAGWSTYAQDRDGAIVLWVEFEETGTADYYQVGTRFNVEDGDFSGDAATQPLVSLVYYYNPIYQYDNTTTDADPTAGKFRLNNTTLASVTEMYINDDSQQGTDIQTLFQNAGVGTNIYISNPNVKLEGAYFTISGAVTNGTDYSTVPLTFVSAGTSQFTDGSIFSFSVDTVGGSTTYADGESIDDDNGNELLEFGVTASAVNHVKLTNQATGNNPKIEAKGGDTNASLELDAQGTGTIKALKAVQLVKGSDIASATALPVTNAGNYFDVTGTTTITSIDSVGIGTVVTLHFDGILTLTHHATDLVLPSAANITTAAGDELTFVEYAVGDWRCISYALASGEAIVGGAGGGDPFGETTVNTHSAGDTILVGEYDSGGTITNRFTDTTAGTVSHANSTGLTAGDKCYLENGGTKTVTWDFTNASDYFNYNSNLTSVSQAVGDARILATFLGSNIWRFE